MKIAKVESLHADAGRRNYDFLKITTDDGLVGWSEYNEWFGGPGVSAVIDRLAPTIIGRDPRAYESLVTLMYAIRRQASGGVIQQAIGAIENALLDIKAKALGVPVYSLLGGPVRDRIRLYWSHCGTYRLAWHQDMQGPTPAHARRRQAGGARRRRRRLHRPQDQRVRPVAATRTCTRRASRVAQGFPELNAERHVLESHPRGAGRLSRGRGAGRGHPGRPQLQLQDGGVPSRGPRHRALQHILGGDRHSRSQGPCTTSESHTTIPVSSCECLFGRRDYRPYFEHFSVDVAIIDTPWNGVAESVKIAAMADPRSTSPPQFLRPPGHPDERALFRGGPQPPDHGDRSRRGPLARRSRHPSRPRSRMATWILSHPRGVGHGGQRGGRARPSPEEPMSPGRAL